MSHSVLHSPLGKETTYASQYQPDLLFPIARRPNRDEIHVPEVLPFKGIDVWNAYELSWLNDKGKPMVAIGEFIVPCESSHLIESKSFKLYLNSFNNTRFASIHDVMDAMQHDLSKATGAMIQVRVIPIEEYKTRELVGLNGICLDDLDVACDKYHVDSSYLKTNDAVVTETLYSHLLKSNCPVTGQPDWASVQIEYTGKQIQHAGLLQYIVSLREHNEFHEQCVERIFMDITRICQPESLTVQARYTRRGGLDINPFRSTERTEPKEMGRLVRQ